MFIVFLGQNPLGRYSFHQQRLRTYDGQFYGAASDAEPWIWWFDG